MLPTSSLVRKDILYECTTSAFCLFVCFPPFMLSQVTSLPGALSVVFLNQVTPLREMRSLLAIVRLDFTKGRPAARCPLSGSVVMPVYVVGRIT